MRRLFAAGLVAILAGCASLPSARERNYEGEFIPGAYVETRKPNLLVVYPDRRADTGEAFYNEPMRQILMDLGKDYDRRFVVAGREKQAYRALRKHPAHLTIIAGHGDGESVILGEGGEEARLDLSDEEELRRAFRRLPEDATIAIFSCVSGKGGFQGDNAANMIKRAAGDRRVIGSLLPLNPFSIWIAQEYPFDVKFHVCPFPKSPTCFDATYEPR